MWRSYGYHLISIVMILKVVYDLSLKYLGKIADGIHSDLETSNFASFLTDVFY